MDSMETMMNDSSGTVMMPADALEEYFRICAASDADCPDTLSARAECFSRMESQCIGEDYSDRYDNASAVWVMVCAILMFFMKAGFLYVEIAFSDQRPQYRRKVVFSKYIDVFAGTFGFWLFGYAISGNTNVFVAGEKQDFIFWFFRFTFASNTATILGGTLVGHKTQLRSIAIMLYSFLMCAFIHPGLARLFWSASRRDPKSLTWSPLDYCNGTFTANIDHTFDWFKGDLGNFVFIDFGGAGVVHVCGGLGSFVLSLFHKIETDRGKKFLGLCRECGYSLCKNQCTKLYTRSGADNCAQQDKEEFDKYCQNRSKGIISQFFSYVYPQSGGDEFIESAALGILILWTTWFAFNAGATESISSKALHAAIGRIALTMCLACASAGMTQVAVTTTVHFVRNDEHFAINEIANSILGALVAVTGCCPFIEPEWAIFIGVMTVVVFHIGCLIEFGLGLYDGARVFPVHGMCGIWGVLCVGLFSKSCLIQELYEDLCFCLDLTLPPFLSNDGDRGLLFAYQLAGVLFIALWSVILCGALFLLLFYIPSSPIIDFYIWCKQKCSRRKKANISGGQDEMNFRGTLLFTNLDEMQSRRHNNTITEDVEIELTQADSAVTTNQAVEIETSSKVDIERKE